MGTHPGESAQSRRRAGLPHPGPSGPSPFPVEISPDNSVSDPVAKTGGPAAGPSSEAPSSTATDRPPHGRHRGRGPHGPRGEQRSRILASAHTEFVERGYEGATIRSIAACAQCDPALVSYYFGTKQELFRACFDLPSDPASEVLSLLLPGPEDAGERLIRYALVLYEERLTADTMQALVRALITDAAAGRRFRSYVRTEVIEPLEVLLGHGTHVAEQVELAMATLYGIVTMRYVVRVEPLASMPRERLVTELAPLVQERIEQAWRG